MDRATADLVLFFLGVAIVKVVADGSYQRYVKAALEPYLWVSAVVMMGLAVIDVVRAARAKPGHGHEQHEHGHGHAHGPAGVLWLLAVPLVVVLFLAPPALLPGSTGRTANLPVAAAPPPAPLAADPEEPVEMTVFGIVQRAFAEDDGGLDGRTLVVEGYAVRGAAGSVDLAQVMIVCCAADARTYRIELAGPGAATVTGVGPRAWWRVTGRLVPGSAAGDFEAVPKFTVVNAEPLPVPENPYGS